MMEIQKGMVVSANSGWWFVVVKVVYDIKTKKTYLYCICDNANNIYYLSVDDIDCYLTLTEIGDREWNGLEREIPLLEDREIPYTVITEVLSGRHDHRFDHWMEKENDI